MAKYFLGIDFGTTNSAAVAIPVVVKSKEDELTIGESNTQPLPSYVAINKKRKNEILTGLDAKNEILESNEDYEVFTSIKSVIDQDKNWVIKEKVWTPVDIAAELFKALKKKVEATIKEKVDEAVVAVPVGFSSKKRNNVRKAALKAGIKVTMFISEPTAAFCSRKNEMKKYSNVAVFDWGGGTLDVSVLQIKGNIVSEQATKGLALAGNDIDRKLADKVCLRAAEKNHKDFKFSDLSEKTQGRILQKCEAAKCQLAQEDTATITELKLDTYGSMLEKIDYDYFSLLIEPEVVQAVDCLLQAISEAGMNRESIDCILCEGGSSQLRPLQTLLKEYFDDEQLLFPRNAMWDIAIGAADIAYNPGCYVLNRPIGILQYNNDFYPLLKAGQRVPTEEKVVQFGVMDATSEARFVLTDGEDEDAQTFTEEFPVKLRGFSDEVITVYCYIDADMVFRMKVHSNRMPDDFYRVWTYSNLKLSYEIEALEQEDY